MVTSFRKRTTMCTCLPAYVLSCCVDVLLEFCLCQMACDVFDWVNKVMAHMWLNVLFTYLFCSYAGIWLMHIRSQPIHAINSCRQIPRGKELYKVQISARYRMKRQCRNHKEL